MNSTQGGKRMKQVTVGIALIVMACTTNVHADSDVFVSVPGVEIKKDGSITAPGVSIDADGSITAPGVSINAGGEGEYEGNAVIQSDGATINTAVAGQELKIEGDDNRLTGTGRPARLVVEGDGNHIVLEDGVDHVLVTGDNNTVIFPGSNVEVEDQGDGNTFPGLR